MSGEDEDGPATQPQPIADAGLADATEPVFDRTTRRVPKIALAPLVAETRDEDDVGPTRTVRPLRPAFDKELAQKRLQTLDAPTVAFGRYTLLGAVGRGGQAEVRLAAEARPDRSVRLCVVKRVPKGQAPEFAEALRLEGRISRHLRHPNIVELYDAGELDGVPYLAFELIDGLSVRELLTALKKEPLPLSAILELGAEAASALAHAHAATDERGRPLHVVHRDVTPQNILVERKGRTKLVDFGIARFSGRGLETRHGLVKGKLGYLAPEQIKGGTLDGRTDVFSLGLVLAELIAGEPVLPRLMMVIAELEPALRQHLARAPYPVPPLVIELLVRLTMIDRDQRLTAADAARELHRLGQLLGPGPTLGAFLGPRVFAHLVPLDLPSVVEGQTRRVPATWEDRTQLERATAATSTELEEDEEEGSYATTVRVARLVPRGPPQGR